MTDEELTAIEQHALSVDSRLGEGCLRVITCLKACRAARSGEQRFLREAQEAAETYHAAWQDAAVYWKGERDRLRAALEKHGQHTEGCRVFFIGLGGRDPCTCGLAEALKES